MDINAIVIRLLISTQRGELEDIHYFVLCTDYTPALPYPVEEDKTKGHFNPLIHCTSEILTLTPTAKL